jgi:hypothetical protein
LTPSLILENSSSKTDISRDNRKSDIPSVRHFQSFMPLCLEETDRLLQLSWCHVTSDATSPLVIQAVMTLYSHLPSNHSLSCVSPLHDSVTDEQWQVMVKCKVDIKQTHTLTAFYILFCTLNHKQATYEFFLWFLAILIVSLYFPSLFLKSWQKRMFVSSVEQFN